MSGTSELGISPVLLQAISHTLTSSDSHSERQGLTDSNINITMEPRQTTATSSPRKVVSHILQGMNTPVASLLRTPQVDSHSDQAPLLEASLDGREDIRHLLKQRLEQRVVVDEGKEGKDTVFVTNQDMSMVNVLTALATHHLKSKMENTAENTDMTTQTEEAHVTDTNRSQPQIIIYYNNESGSVPSPDNDVVVGDVDSGMGDGQTYRVVVQQAEQEDLAAAKQSRVMEDYTGGQFSSSISQVSDASDIPLGLNSDTMGGPCPICADKISGYHYGIFTCESCKGFFKRTVQNKKSFSCHQRGECQINIYNRKKCPACRFTKCVMAGMKLEAIRQNRTRGGRSSYDGCSPRRPKPSPLERKMKRVVPSVPMSTHGESSKSHLVAILNHTTPAAQQVQDGNGLMVPELLTDIMNLEPLLSDEDIPEDMVPEGMEENEESLYTYLMQLTELRLYKLVRWARNLPQFGSISTDDQILLLQNCWSDLLALGVCWRSIHTPNALSLSAGKTINEARAKTFGFEDLVGRMIALSDHMRRLEVDQLEYVAMKVLLLISPDVKGLKDPGKILEHQEKLSEALLTYTSSHYPAQANKYGEVLLRLPELARISFLGKELLLNRLPPNMTSCGLLVELLKGENAAKDL